MRYFCSSSCLVQGHFCQELALIDGISLRAQHSKGVLASVHLKLPNGTRYICPKVKDEMKPELKMK